MQAYCFRFYFLSVAVFIFGEMVSMQSLLFSFSCAVCGLAGADVIVVAELLFQFYCGVLGTLARGAWVVRWDS